MSSRASGEAGLVVTRATEADTEALRGLFERENVPCHCRYWHVAGDKNAWLERCAFHPEENASEFAASLREADATLLGVVARRGSEAVGWMKITPAERVQKLYEQRVYRGLPCFTTDRSGVYTIGCFLVASEDRRTGVANELLAHGIELARAAGARSIEAFPRRGELLSAEEQWTGPAALFLRAGFQVVSDFQPYPVLRLAL